MRLNSDFALLSRLRLLLIVVSMIGLVGCNSDVFVPRPSFTSITLSVGENTVIDLPKYTDESDIWIDVVYENGGILYTGSIRGFNLKFVTLKYGIIEDGVKVTIKAETNYYPKAVTFRIHCYTWEDTFEIVVKPQYAGDYLPGKINYTTNTWFTDSRRIEYETGWRENKTDAPSEITVTPGIECPLTGHFEFDDRSAIYLFGSQPVYLPILLVDDKGFPMESPLKIEVDENNTTIPGHELKCLTPFSVTIPAMSTIHYLIYLNFTMYDFRFSLPVTNSDGVTLNLSGKWILNLPETYDFELLDK